MKEELLEELAAKLGTTTEYLWGVLIHERMVNAIGGIIWVFLFGIFLVALSRMPKWAKVWDTTDTQFFWMMYAFAVVLYAVIGSVVLVSNVQDLLYAEGAALTYLIDMLR